uniref:Putative secreted protein n=1 Tax=Ixodes scapularis TaxID=6945 RepID=A0A4D5RDC2_IXOSC
MFPSFFCFFFLIFILFDLLARAFSNVCSPPGKRSTHSGCRCAGNVSLCFVAHFQTSNQRRSRTRQSL